MRAKKLFALSALIFFTSSITASVSFYGKLNFSYENEDSAEESNTDFVNNDGWVNSKTNGKMRLEGKDYIVQDGDVLNFRFNT